MGLAIVKEIAERHQGEVWVETGIERGFSISVSISKSL
jgi:signal transduction histidine kinase